MKILGFCKPYLLSQKNRLFFFITLSFVGSLISIASPYILGDFMDQLVQGANDKTIIRFCALFGGISVFKIIKDYSASMIYTRMQVKMGYELNMDVISHVQKLSLSFLGNQERAYLNHRINDDCYALVTFCITTLRDLIINTATVVIPVIILFSLNKMILLIMCGFISLYIVVYHTMKKKMYNAGVAYREGLAKFSASRLEQLKHIAQIKINSVQPEYHKRTASVFSRFYDTVIRSQRVNYIYTSFDGIVATFAQIALFVVGGLLVIRGSFTIGLFTIFSSYFRTMLSSCRYFFGLASAFQSALVSYNRTRDILCRQVESNGKTTLQHVDTIELRNVCFSYGSQEQGVFDPSGDKAAPGSALVQNSNDIMKPIISSFSYDFSKGNLYAVTGHNGAGKTTLTKLMIGLYIDERSGNIAINGIPMRELDMVHIRKNLVGYAEQDPLLIEDSICYNLTYQEYNEDASFRKRLEELAPILDMERFLDEKTLSFRVNEENNNLSGGEKQKLAILKVLLKDPDVMIFDEPTSALDKETKSRFIRYLSRLKENKIIIVVTHDNELVSASDRVLDFPGVCNTDPEERLKVI